MAPLCSSARYSSRHASRLHWHNGHSDLGGTYQPILFLAFSETEATAMAAGSAAAWWSFIGDSISRRCSLSWFYIGRHVGEISLLPLSVLPACFCLLACLLACLPACLPWLLAAVQCKRSAELLASVSPASGIHVLTMFGLEYLPLQLRCMATSIPDWVCNTPSTGLSCSLGSSDSCWGGAERL